MRLRTAELRLSHGQLETFVYSIAHDLRAPLRTMQGFTRSLGTKCTHCHVADHWDSEDKEEKQVTRDMMAMTRAINEDYLKKIKALEQDKPSANCFLCHRGHAHAGEELRPPASPAPAR